MSKSTIAYILYSIAFVLLFTPAALDLHVKKEEQARKAHFVSTHPCHVISSDSQQTYYDWQSDSVKRVSEARKYKCDGLDGQVLIKDK